MVRGFKKDSDVGNDKFLDVADWEAENKFTQFEHSGKRSEASESRCFDFHFFKLAKIRRSVYSVIRNDHTLKPQAPLPNFQLRQLDWSSIRRRQLP